MSGMERSEEMKAGYPIVQDVNELFEQQEVDHIQAQITAHPELEGIFNRFCKLRRQIQSISRELLFLNSHRAALIEILAEQQKKGLYKSQRREIMRWVNELSSAREQVILDQVPLTDYDLKGADFSWVVYPFELKEEEKQLQELDIVQAASRHAAVKLYKAMQRQLGERMVDEEYEEEEEDFGPQ